MKNKAQQWESRQSEYLLEYDRHKILECADIFSNLGMVFSQTQLPGELPAETESEQSQEADRQKIWESVNAQESRNHLAGQMRYLSVLLRSVAQNNVQLICLGGKQKRQIVRALAAEGVEIQDLYLVRGDDGKAQLSVTAASKRKRAVTTEEIAGYLSVLMDMRLKACRRNPFFIGEEPVNLYFEKETALGYLTGAAMAIREGERVSGDSYTFLEHDNSLTILLSDGVGCGEKASRDSSQVIELTEQMLDAGLLEELAVDMLNGIVRAQPQEVHMSTLDLCRVDLQEKKAKFLKKGGVCSFIRHADTVERIEYESLPLGAEKDSIYEEESRLLEDGDMIIMLSDGVLQDWSGPDCFGDLQEQIARIQTKSPQDMANRLLRYAIGQCRGQIRDDMTILAAGVWENSIEEQNS